jgi:hypothetical protein
MRRVLQLYYVFISAVSMKAAQSLEKQSKNVRLRFLAYGVVTNESAERNKPMRSIATLILGVLLSVGIAGCMAPVMEAERANRQEQEAVQQEWTLDNQESAILHQEQEVDQELLRLKKQQQQ